ncbi:hypothetical protein SteCoe_5160 [Stentor coeruleus]|uniref:Uncharacterized protein n=1 Tax=Stentor coeruleus TaxID=5963 RepID=A0A1R2CT88_9CILI|nr:hypothetical protein SteCoe_5160 [Stentor coeruleus]
MSKPVANSPTMTRKFKLQDRLSPEIGFNKHIRIRKAYKPTSAGSLNFKNMQMFTSYSPKERVADAFLKSIDGMCHSTKQIINTAKNNIISLKIKIREQQELFENDFKNQDNDIILQCREFINDRKFTLKSKQDFNFTKRLERQVTKKMLG